MAVTHESSFPIHAASPVVMKGAGCSSDTAQKSASVIPSLDMNDACPEAWGDRIRPASCGNRNGVVAFQYQELKWFQDNWCFRN